MSTDRRPSQVARRLEAENSLIERAAARLTIGGRVQPVPAPMTVSLVPDERPAAPRRSGVIPVPAVPSAVILEQFRMICHQLRRRTVDHGEHHGLSVMVTSPRAGDGKTFVAIHLAQALASQGDSEVVLIDAHLDRPSIATRLGITAEIGLRDYLCDTPIQLSDVLVATDVPGLLLLPAGPAARPNMTLGGRLRGVLTDLRQSCGDRIVVFDTPPALAGSSMPYLLAPLVDEVIVVVAADETEAASVGETLERFQEHAGKLNLVFNKAGRGTGMKGEAVCSSSITG